VDSVKWIADSVKCKVKSGVESGESGVDKRCDRNKTGRS
jgi:hypothetical protein